MSDGTAGDQETKNETSGSKPFCNEGLCARDELIRDLKACLGVNKDDEGEEFCIVYKGEWAEIIKIVQDAQY